MARRLEHKLEAQAYRAALRDDLASFIARTFATLDGGQAYHPNWHIELIADRLERCYRREIKRLIIALPPRNLKSICASVAFPAWALGHNPTLRFICVSYAQDLAGKHARDTRTIMLQDWYRRTFPNAGFNPAKMAEEEFAMLAGGYRLATSVGGTLTGRGGNIIIIDDPMKPQEALSDTKRDSVRQWYDSTLSSRLDNKKDDVIILIMQRVHVDDLVAHVLDKEDWEVLKLPAIALENERFLLSDGRWVGRSAGEALHPVHEPLHTLKQLKKSMGSLAFSAQYQQTPVPPEGNLIKWRYFTVFDEPPAERPGDQIIQSWDTATTLGNSSDYSVCTTWLQKKKRYYLLDILRERLEFPELKSAVIRQAAHYGAKTVLIEDAGIGTALIQAVRRLGGLHVIATKPTGGKADRLAAQLNVIEAGDVLIPRKAPWLDTLREESCAFPGGKHDDQIDSISQFLNWAERPKARAGVLW